jgi:hypothetical protein
MPVDLLMMSRAPDFSTSRALFTVTVLGTSSSRHSLRVEVTAIAGRSVSPW